MQPFVIDRWSASSPYYSLADAAAPRQWHEPHLTPDTALAPWPRAKHPCSGASLTRCLGQLAQTLAGMDGQSLRVAIATSLPHPQMATCKERLAGLLFGQQRFQETPDSPMWDLEVAAVYLLPQAVSPCFTLDPKQFDRHGVLSLTIGDTTEAAWVTRWTADGSEYQTDHGLPGTPSLFQNMADRIWERYALTVNLDLCRHLLLRPQLQVAGVLTDVAPLIGAAVSQSGEEILRRLPDHWDYAATPMIVSGADAPPLIEYFQAQGLHVLATPQPAWAVWRGCAAFLRAQTLTLL